MLVTIFYHVDEFCKSFEATVKEKAVEMGEKARRESMIPTLSLSEIITICIFYHYSGFKDFKSYYKNYINGYLRSSFTKLVSYNRFIELKENAVIPLMLFLKVYCQARCTGTSFIDSFSLKVCHNRRIYSNKVFKNHARRGKTSIGWFYGFKIHLLINHMGEIIDFYVTPGNVADNNASLLERLTKNVFGKLFGDRGYIINQQLFGKLYENGVHLITKIRQNMKNILMDMGDKLMLRKRGTVESVIGVLKESYSIEHSRHRSVTNFLCHILSALTAYCFKPQKPSIIQSDRIIEQFA